MIFEVRILHWAKRRKADPIRGVAKVILHGYQPIRAHLSSMDIVFKDGEALSLHAQVAKNPVTGKFSVNGIDANGNQVAVDILDS